MIYSLIVLTRRNAIPPSFASTAVSIYQTLKPILSLAFEERIFKKIEKAPTQCTSSCLVWEANVERRNACTLCRFIYVLHRILVKRNDRTAPKWQVKLRCLVKHLLLLLQMSNAVLPYDTSKLLLAVLHSNAARYNWALSDPRYS